MDAHEHVLGAVDLAVDERDVDLAGQLLAERDRRELAVGRRQPHGGHPLDELLVPAAVLDQVGDGDQLQPVLAAEGDQVGHARHRPVLLHHLADDAGRDQARRGGRGRPRPRSGRCARARRRARARSGKTWPGWTRSCAPFDGSTATWIVRERSCAEIPVVIPSRASIETVKAVPYGVSLCSVIGRRPSSSQRSSVRQRQIRPARVDGHEVDRLRASRTARRS